MTSSIARRWRSGLATLLLLTLLRPATTAAQIVASGKTLTVTTANAVAAFNGPDLVGLTNSVTNESYLKRPSGGELAQVDAISGSGPSMTASNWSIAPEAGTGVPLATLTSQDALRRFTIAVKIDSASQEIVVRASASVTSPGVRGASWSIAGLDLAWGRWIVPANSGSIFNAANPGINAFIAYPNSWQAQMAVYEAGAGSLLLYSTDTQLYFKQLRQTTRGNSTLDVAIYTEATAPWPPATTVPGVEWRLKAFAGDWRVAAQPFKDWMVAAHPPLSNAAHPWVSNIRTVVEIGYHDTSLLTLLAAKAIPSQTLLYIPDWRQSAYDVNYPDYTPATGVAAFISAAHALGFKVMLHTDIIGVTPTNSDYAGVQQYQTKTPETLQPIGQFWDQPSNPLRYGLIDPAASAFRSLWITRVGAAVSALNPDALHLDFTAMYNDGNGPIEGRTFTQGEDLFNQQIVAAFPNVAIGSEEEFDFTYRYHSFAQADLFAFSAPGHPISTFLFSPQVYYYSNLTAPPPSDPSFKSHLLDMQRRTILPMWWVAGSGDLDTSNVDNARFIGMVQSFQTHAFQPAWTADWTGALARYQGLAGATAALTDDGPITALSTSTPQSTLFQLAHDANQLTTGSFINRWPAFDNTTLYGLNPSSLYFVDSVARPDATHATALPQRIQLGSGTLVTSSFAHLEFAPPIAVDFTNLSQALLGVRYQGVDYPIGLGAVVQTQTNTVGGVNRPSLFIHPPWQGQVGGETFAEYSVPVPSAAALRFSVGIDDGAGCTDGVTFRVTISGNEVWHQNFNKGAWHDVVLSLASYAGTTVPLRLISNPGPASNPSCDFGAWSKVAVAVPTSTISVPMQLASGSIFSGIDGASYSQTTSVSGTVTNVTIPGGFTVFTQTGTTVTSGTGLTTPPFDVWSADQSGGLLKPGSVFNAGAAQSETSGGVTKNPAIWAHPPNGGRTVLSWALRLPANPLKLGWSAGIIDNAYSDDGVTFEVRINGLPYWSLVAGVHGDNHWTSGQLDLSRWQGQSILLELVTDSRANNNADWAAWGDLVLSGSSVSCSYSVPSSASVSAIGGSSTANVTATATCSWSTASNVPWLTVVSGSGNGNGTLTYDVAPNLGVARSGALTVAGQTLTVTQGRSPTAPLNLSTDLVSLGIAASNMVPNQPGLDAGPLFVQGVEYAKTHGIGTVIADPGSYYFLTLTEINAHFAFRNIDNMTIDLHGADLVFTHPLYYGMIVYYSTNAVVQNFTADYQPLPYTQVRVVSVDTVIAQVHYATQPGWPDPTTLNAQAAPPGMSPNVILYPFRNGRPVLRRLFSQLPLTANQIAVNNDAAPLAALRPGDLAVVNLANGTNAVSYNHCTNCALRNATIYSSSTGAVQGLTVSGMVMERVYDIPKPGTDRLVSAMGLAIFPVAGPNNRIRLSRAIRTMDDGIDVSGQIIGTVQSQLTPRRLVIEGSGGPSVLGGGDTVPNGTPVNFQRLADGALLGPAVIVSQSAATTTPLYRITFDFDRDLPSGLVGNVMYSTDADQNGSGTIVERNTVQGIHCCKGMYINGIVNSTLRGNYIRRTAFAGMFLLDSTVASGDPPNAPLTNLSVSNNVIDGTNLYSDWWWFQFGSIQSVTLTTAFDLMTGSPFSNLNITNNFIADSGRSGVWLGNTNGGSVTGNYLLNPNARPDVANAYPGRPGDALRPLVIDTTSSGITTANNTIDTTSRAAFVTDTTYRELAAYAPGGTIRLNAYNLGALATSTLTLTDADGVVTPIAIQSTTPHALDVQIPPSAALGGTYLTLTSTGGAKYFGTLFVDSQDNIPAVNGCTYESSPSATSVASAGGSLSILVITQAGCAFQVVDSDAFVTTGGGGTGTGVVSVTLATNTLFARSTTIEIAGQPITVTQQGAPQPTLNLSRDLVALGIAASNMTPNQPSLDAGPLFVRGVDYAKTHGISTVIADPGAYYFLSLLDNTHVAVNHVDNMTIDLHGADLIFTHPLYYGMIVYYSTNAVVQNFTADYQPLPYTQVRVSAVDVPNARIQYVVEPGWADPSTFNSLPSPNGTPSVILHFFRNGRPVLKRLFAQFPLSSTQVIVGNDPPTLSALRPGDMAVIALNAANTINFNNCTGCTLRNVTVYSGSGGGVLAVASPTSAMERVYSVPKPGTDRLVSSFGLAIEVTGSNNQIRLSRAIRTMDDGFAYGGLVVGTVQNQTGTRSLKVDATGGPTVLGEGNGVPNGTPVAFQRPSDGAVLASAVIVSQGPPTGSPLSVTYGFDRDLPGNLVGTSMYSTDPNSNGANSVLERSTVQSQSCCRGLNVAALANSAVRKNYIRRSAFSGIDALQGMTGGEPPVPPLVNLNISNNVLDGTSTKSDWWWFEFGAIQSVTLTTAYDLMTSRPFTNLNVTNNFIADSGRSAVWLGNTSGGSITGNYILNPNARPDLANAYQPRLADATKPLVVDTTSSGITTSSNTIDKTSGVMFVADTQYRELAAYAPGGTIRLNAYNLGALAAPAVTLTDADGTTTPMAIQSTTAQAIDVQLPAATALGGAYVTLTAAGAKYFGTLFIDSQDNIPAVNGCTYEPSLSSTSVSSGASNLPILVVTQAGCSYQVLATDSFVNPGGGATGTAVISVGFAANAGAARSTTIEIAGQPITVTQSATCSYSVPTGVSIGAAGGSLSLNLTATATCPWSAVSNTAWLTITSGSGSGNGTVNYFVAPNTGPARTGTLTIAGQTFTVSQSAQDQSGCTFAITPPSANFSLSGGSGSVAITTMSFCSWTVTNIPAWASTVSGDSGTGSGTWQYTVASNTGGARAQTVTVAGQSFLLQQTPPLRPLVSGRRMRVTLADNSAVQWIGVETTAGRSYCVDVAPAATSTSAATPTLAGFRGDGTTPLGAANSRRLCFRALGTETALLRLTQSDTAARSYELLANESTLWANWFYVANAYSSYTLLRNTTDATISATITWRSDSGTAARTMVVDIAAHSVKFYDARTTTFGSGVTAGSVEVAHDGAPGALVGSQTTLSPVTGLSFDTVFMQRARW